MTRKSIIFDKKTPGVFYCPQHKPTGERIVWEIIFNSIYMISHVATSVERSVASRRTAKKGR